MAEWKADEQFELRNARVEMALKKIGELLRVVTPEGFGFSLLFWEFEGDSIFYTSNCAREDVVKGMAEFISKQSEHQA